MDSVKQNIEINGEFLVKEYRRTGNPAYKEGIVRAYSPLIKYIIGRMNVGANGLLNRDDLYQCGIIGLLKSLERFKLEYNVKFRTFAQKRIHGEIVDAIRREGVVGRDKFEKIKLVENAVHHLTNANGCEPAMAEVCDHIDISENEYYSIENASQMNYMLSLDTKITDDEGSSVYRVDMLESDDEINPEELLHREKIKDLLREIIPALPERKRLILALYFFEELKLYDIGQVLGVSEARVSQLLNETLLDLRTKLMD